MSEYDEYDYRHPETLKEIEKFNNNLKYATLETKKFFRMFLSGQYSWEQFQEANGVKKLVDLGYYISTRPNINDIIDSYKDFGISAEHVKGAAWHFDSMVAVNHNGIQYVLDDRGLYFKDKETNSIEHTIKHFKLISTHYEDRVKSIYNHLQSNTEQPIWVLAGGGYQIQASFGNEEGYIATLMLDVNTYVKVGVENVQKSKAISKKAYELALSSLNFNRYFTDFKDTSFTLNIL
jgi:hypothetical protein